MIFLESFNEMLLYNKQTAAITGNELFDSTLQLLELQFFHIHCYLLLVFVCKHKVDLVAVIDASVFVNFVESRSAVC